MLWRPLAGSETCRGLACRPVTVSERGDGTFDLVVGFDDAVAIRRTLSEIDAVVLPEACPKKDLAEILLTGRTREIRESAVARACFVQLLTDLNVPQEDILSYFQLLQMEAHSSVLAQYLSVAETLPHRVALFCHEKKLSLRQCLHWSVFDGELLNRLFDLQRQLSLTVSVIDELLENIADLCKREGVTPAAFFEEAEALLCSPASAQERTLKLRSWVRQRRYPVLSKINGRLQSIRGQLSLPESVSVSWDPSLESEDLRVAIRVTEESEWKQAVESLHTRRAGETAAAILRELRRPYP